MADSDLQKLEFFSLVAKVSQELDNHLGIKGEQGKLVAEFIISIHEQSKKLSDFKKSLEDKDAHFPDAVVDNIDRLILTMHPKYKKKKNKNQAAANGKGKENGEEAAEEKDKQKRMFPGLALANSEWEPSLPPKGKEGADKDNFMKQVDDVMSHFESGAKLTHPRPAGADSIDEPAAKRRRHSRSPPPYRDGPNSRGGYGRDERRGRNDQRGGRPPVDERPVLFKIYNGRVSGLRDFGAFVQLDGVSPRAEGARPLPYHISLAHLHVGMVHVSMIQVGARANAPSDLLTRGQAVKVKVMSIAGTKISLSMKDVDQTTGRDLTPHLRIKSEAELIEEERQHAARTMTGTNAIPLGAKDEQPVRSAKRLTSPERWEIKQLISSGVLDASEYPDLDEDFSNPTARAEVEEELDVEVREDEPAFLRGQTKRTLDLSPVKIVKAPDGSLNRAAVAGASLAKERRELRQQEANEQADSEARDFNTPWLDPMSKEGEKVFAQDLRGHLRGQQAEQTQGWKAQSFNKATTFGEITSLSIQDQRKSLPIYKLRDQLLQAIRDVRDSCHHIV
jgi:ATP-dependent RNA helicase DHX8/PRP22